MAVAKTSEPTTWTRTSVPGTQVWNWTGQARSVPSRSRSPGSMVWTIDRAPLADLKTTRGRDA